LKSKRTIDYKAIPYSRFGLKINSLGHMLKATLFSVFTSTAILIGALFADGVVIDHNTPETLNPGEKKIVSICINKGEVTGLLNCNLRFLPA